MKAQTGNCQYPVQKSQFAKAALKRCGSVGSTALCLVPFAAGPQIEWQPMRLCTRHASDLSVWRFLSDLDAAPFAEDEIAELIAAGYEHSELVPKTMVITGEGIGPIEMEDLPAIEAHAAPINQPVSPDQVSAAPST
jgi:hypothetical protein